MEPGCHPRRLCRAWPLVDLAHLAALLGIEPYAPADADDLAVLRDLLARRTVLAQERGSWLACHSPIPVNTLFDHGSSGGSPHPGHHPPTGAPFSQP